MTDYRKLSSGIGRAAWAYFFLYFDVTINTVDLLPAFVGYALYLSAIRLIQEEARELTLLRPLAILLTLWHGADWIFGWFGGNLHGSSVFLDLIITITNLYFHFQLLTNLASIGAKYQPEGLRLDARLLKYRSMQTVMITGIAILSDLSDWLGNASGYLSGCMAVVYLIAGICLMKALFDLRKCLPIPENNE